MPGTNSVENDAASRREHFRDLQRRSAKARSVRKLESTIRALVDSAPPLDDATRDRLAVLLRSTA